MTPQKLEWEVEEGFAEFHKELVKVGLLRLEVVKSNHTSIPSSVFVVNDATGFVFVEKRFNWDFPVERLRDRALWIAFKVLDEQLKLVLKQLDPAE